MQNSMMILGQTPFLGKAGSTIQNCLFKAKLVTETNLNMQNSMVMFTFSVFDWKYPFWPNWSEKSKLSV